MSEKWETVGNGKAKQTGGSKSKANGTKNSKKPEKPVYSVEDVLPASSVKNMYQAAFDPSPKKDSKATK